MAAGGEADSLPLSFSSIFIFHSFHSIPFIHHPFKTFYLSIPFIHSIPPSILHSLFTSWPFRPHLHSIHHRKRPPHPPSLRALACMRHYGNIYACCIFILDMHLGISRRTVLFSSYMSWWHFAVHYTPLLSICYFVAQTTIAA